MSTEETPLFFRRGDGRVLTFEVLEDDEPYDLTNVQLIRFTVKDDEDDLDSDAKLRLSTGVGGVTILTQSGNTLGRFQVSLANADSQALFDKRYTGRYDIQLTLGGGEPVTPFIGNITFGGDVTHNTGDVGTDT